MKISQKYLKEFMRGTGDMNFRMASNIMFAMDSDFKVEVKEADDATDIFNMFEKND